MIDTAAIARPRVQNDLRLGKPSNSNVTKLCAMFSFP